mmetsp:Transcript_60948/g.178189  ORF Transcript_60948/g.178189 Transcript_60948/m.178189 type:complete len:218 (+) Transcript_60948:1214-1867(+)
MLGHVAWLRSCRRSPREAERITKPNNCAAGGRPWMQLRTTRSGSSSHKSCRAFRSLCAFWWNPPWTAVAACSRSNPAYPDGSRSVADGLRVFATCVRCRAHSRAFCTTSSVPWKSSESKSLSDPRLPCPSFCRHLAMSPERRPKTRCRSAVGPCSSLAANPHELRLVVIMLLRALLKLKELLGVLTESERLSAGRSARSCAPGLLSKWATNSSSTPS